MVVHLTPLHFHSTLVPTGDLSLGTSHPDVLIDLVQRQAGATEQKTSDFAEVAKLTDVLLEVFSHDTAAERVIRT